MASDLAIRDFTEDYYPLLAAVDAAAHDDDPRAAVLWRHDDSTRDPNLFFRRHVVTVDGTAVACGVFGHSDWIDDPDKYWFQILVPRDRAGAAIRENYLRHALDTLARRNPYSVFSGMVESYEAHIRFLEDNGFRAVHREHFSRLELDEFEPIQHGDATKRGIREGIRMVRLSEFVTTDPDWRERLHPVYQQLVAEQPAPDPPRLDTLVEWTHGVVGAPDFDPDLWIVGLDGDHIVGLSQAMFSPDSPTVAHCGLTGVLSDYRRRGLATALKVAMLTRAKQRGILRINTSNEANNPMYQINLRLGFVPRPDWVMFERRL